MTKNIFGSFLLLCVLFLSARSSAQNQATIDDKVLNEYFAKHHIKPIKTPSGLYYTITKAGAGANAHPGQNVSMNYLGKFLDGKSFDGNVDENYNPASGRGPLKFTLGVGQVIRGWDEGVRMFNPGSRGVLYIPSGMAYGPGGRGPIPPNSILVFNVELLSAD